MKLDMIFCRNCVDKEKIPEKYSNIIKTEEKDFEIVAVFKGRRGKEFFILEDLIEQLGIE